MLASSLADPIPDWPGGCFPPEDSKFCGPIVALAAAVTVGDAEYWEVWEGLYCGRGAANFGGVLGGTLGPVIIFRLSTMLLFSPGWFDS